MGQPHRFAKGVSGNPNGRPKGSKNLPKGINVGALFEAAKFDPFKVLINLALSAKSEKVRCDAAIELCNYIAPKLKQIEFKTDENNAPFLINLNMLPGTKQLESIEVTPNQKLMEEIVNDEEKD